jgi:replicative DNA helicase
MMFSLEMPAEMVYEREAQIQCRVSGEQVEARHKTLEAESMCSEMAARGSDKFYVCKESCLDIDEIAGMIEMAILEHGDIGVVGIDYLGLINCKSTNLVERVELLAIGVKRLAKQYNVPVVFLVQTNRQYSEASGTEIQMDSGYGGIAIEANCDFYIGMWVNPDIKKDATKTEEANPGVCLKLLKNRNGKKGLRWEVKLDPNTFNFKGLRLLPDNPPGTRSRKSECNF